MHAQEAEVQVENGPDGGNLTAEQVWARSGCLQQLDVRDRRLERPRYDGRHLPVQFPIESLVRDPQAQGSAPEATIQTLSSRHEQDYLHLRGRGHEPAALQRLVQLRGGEPQVVCR